MQSLSELSNEENSEEEYEVEKILKERTIQGKDKKTGRVIKTKEYLVKWVGYNAQNLGTRRKFGKLPGNIERLFIISNNEEIAKRKKC